MRFSFDAFYTWGIGCLQIHTVNPWGKNHPPALQTKADTCFVSNGSSGPLTQQSSVLEELWIFQNPVAGQLPFQTMEYIQPSSPASITPHLEEKESTNTERRPHSLKAGVRLAATEQRTSNTPASSRGRSPGAEPCMSGDFPLGPLFFWPRTHKAGGPADTKPG